MLEGKGGMRYNGLHVGFVSVAQRGGREVLVQQREAGDGIGPRRQTMPDFG